MKLSYNGARSETGKATKSETLLFRIRKSYMYMAWLKKQLKMF